MKEAKATSDLNTRIAARVRELRAAQRLSLDALATKSAVSRSMLSLIERGESSPTAVVLEKTAAALGVTLASLFETPASSAKAHREPIARRKDQPEWRDPESGYVRRNLSPAHVPQPIQLIEVHFPARGKVTFEGGARELRIFQQIWILEGAMNITHGEITHQLKQGDCLAVQLDRPMRFHNPTSKPARYAVAIAHETAARR